MKAYLIRVKNPFNWRKGMSYLATIIRVFTGKKYNHAGVAVGKSKEHILIIYHAVKDGVVKVDFAEWRLEDDEREFVIEDVPTDFTHEEVIARAESKVGIPYELLGLPQLALVKIGRKFFNQDWYIGRKDEKAYDKVTCYKYARWCFGDKKAYIAMPDKKIVH